MTFVLAAATMDYVVQISDRRLTAFDRRGRPSVYKEEENKAIFWNAPDARLAVSYTGIARVRGEPTERWLMSLMADAVENSGYEINAATERLRVLLGDALGGLPAAHRRLTVMCTGFISQDGMRSVFPGNCLITNFQDYESNVDSPFAWDEFVPRYSSPRDDFDGPFSLIQFAGNWQAVDINEVELLRPLLEEQRPPPAVIGKAVELFDIWAARSKFIGRQLTSMVIRVSDLDRPTWQYHTKSNSQVLYGGSTVMTRLGQGSLMVSDPQIKAEGEGARPAVVPTVPRKAPCPCGSGKRYKHCHGAFDPHKPLPPPPEQRIEIPPE